MDRSARQRKEKGLFRIEQTGRILARLHEYRPAFTAINYTSGSGRAVPTAHDVWANLVLITLKVRPAFMVQWVDYLSPKTYYTVMQLLTHYRDGLEGDDVDYRPLFLSDPQGVIVTTYSAYYKQGLKGLYAAYRGAEGDVEDRLLGKILGYPAAGEAALTDEDKTAISAGHRPLGRYVASIYAAGETLPATQLMANIYRSTGGRARFYTFYQKVAEALRLVDPETAIILSDEQAPETFSPPPRPAANVSTEEKAAYREFARSPGRLLENWNADFDRIFEQGCDYCS